MHAEIRTVKEPALRVQIVEQRAEFDQNQQFLKRISAAARRVAKQLVSACKLLPAVTIDYDLRVKRSTELDVDGLRDIVTNRAASSNSV